MKKLVLIDGNSLLNRAFYATPVFSTRSGMPTNAIFGFTKLLFKIISDLKPEYLIVAFDLKAPTFRHNLYDGYKATRKPMPEDLAVQVEPLKALLSAMNIATCSKEGYEADDIIGTLANKFDVHSYIYTGDRDSFQLVNKNVDVFYTKRGVSDLLKLNSENFKTETGVEPHQIIDLKALMGDKSDNIPGVPGIGEKTALKMLSDFDTLDNIYNNIHNIQGSSREKLLKNKELAYMSYKLATIVIDCDLDIKLENCTVPEKFNEEVKKLFEDFEFNSLLGLDIFETSNIAEETKHKYPEKIDCSSFEQIQYVLQENKIFSVIAGQAYAEIFVDNKLYSIEIADNLLNNTSISFSSYCKILKNIFENSENTVITFGCKDLMHLLKSMDISFSCNFDDVLLAKYLCDFNATWSTLKEFCSYNSYDSEYAAYAVNEIFKKYKELLNNENLTELYEKIEKPLLVVLFEMETEGVKVSTAKLDELSERFILISEEYKHKIYEECGCEFNINSPAQLGNVLCEKLGIKEVTKRGGKYSTSADILEKIKETYPVAEHILKYRMYQKLNSTYLVGFKPLLDRNSMIHTTYNQTLTTTGRLSSTNPNLQNIPIREEEGRELRKIFVPKEGNIFIDADYSQIELRLLAHFSDCKELISAYNNNIDIHAVTASQVFGVDIEKVTPKMRREAKAVNFGIIYGISDFGLSKNLNIPLATAREYIERYFKSYSAVKEYMNSNVDFAKKNGYISTLTGRKRVIPEINSPNYNLRQFGERAAMNMPLQGTSADIIKIAMVNVRNALKKYGLNAKLILQVHDELVIDAPISEAEKAAEILKYEMENAIKLKVPLIAEVHTGRDWYEAK